MSAANTSECVCVHRGLAFRCQSVRLKGAPHMFRLLPASPSIPSLTGMVSVRVPCHKHIPPTGTVRRGVSWSRFRNKTAYSATARTTSNAILCCLSFSYSDNLASSHPSSPRQPDRWCGHHWVSSLSAFWLRIREESAGMSVVSYMFFFSAPPEHSETWWAEAHSCVPINSYHTDAREDKYSRQESKLRIRLHKSHTTASPDAVFAEPSSWAWTAHGEGWGVPVQSIRSHARTSPRARTHTHKHSIPWGEGGQSCDLSLEQQISAPWTETQRSNTGEEEEEERRNFSMWGILRQTPNTDMCYVQMSYFVLHPHRHVELTCSFRCKQCH